MNNQISIEFSNEAQNPAFLVGAVISCPTCYECGKSVATKDLCYDGDVIFHQNCFEKCFIEK